MHTQDLKQIKQLIDQSLDEKLDRAFLDQDKRLDKRFERRFEKMSIEIDGRFKQERKWNNKKFSEILTSIGRFADGSYRFDAKINDHEARIQKLEELSA